MRYVVYAQYAHQDFSENEVISVHKNYALAERAAWGWSARAIREYPGKVKKGDNLRALEITRDSEVYARKYMESLAQNVGKTLAPLTISESVELLESAIDELETMREDLALRLESDY